MGTRIVTQPVVAYARTERDESLIEQALEGGGVAYSLSLDAAPDAPGEAVCFLARAYNVGADDVARAKAILEAHGLARCLA